MIVRDCLATIIIYLAFCIQGSGVDIATSLQLSC